MRMLSSPNLPRRRVTLAAVSAGAVHTIAWMEHHGIQAIPILPDHRLAAPVHSHADMLLHHFGEHLLISAVREKATTQQLTKEGFVLLPPRLRLGEQYPHDVRLNALRLGNLLVGKLSALDPALVEECQWQGIRMMDCAQGYARCACVVLTEKAVITADPSLERVLKHAGVDVLRIRPGFVSLPGYSYGFLGGCCGLIGPDTLLCAGDLKSHPDGEIIRDFAAAHGVEILCTPEPTLTDIGGILPLLEES